MALFLRRHDKKVDGKGRVLIPAQFRQVIGADGYQGFAALPSHRLPAIEAYSMDFLEQLMESVTDIPLFSDEHDSLTATIFGSAQQISIDGDGRITLPPSLAEHAGITDRAIFFGRGRTFQIWQPDALDAHVAEAAARAKDEGLTLPVRPRKEG